MALPATLAESELFGHEKGAFTGAAEKKPGKLEVAGRGTVLLDEVGDMDPALQGKLLRVLEERTFERVGGVKPIEMGARVISASHRDLGALVEENRFRLDLYHRLSVFPIAIAPLRARGEDVIVLANHFIADYGARMQKKVAPISSSAGEVRAMMLAYDWPGNVRELKNVIERAVILATTEVTPELLPERMREAPRGGRADQARHARVARRLDAGVPPGAGHARRSRAPPARGGAAHGRRQEGQGGRDPRHQPLRAAPARREVRSHRIVRKRTGASWRSISTGT